MKYIHNFETESDFLEQYNGGGYLEPWVSYTKELDTLDNNVAYNKSKKIKLILYSNFNSENIATTVTFNNREVDCQTLKNVLLVENINPDGWWFFNANVMDGDSTLMRVHHNCSNTEMQKTACELCEGCFTDAQSGESIYDETEGFSQEIEGKTIECFWGMTL